MLFFFEKLSPIFKAKKTLRFLAIFLLLFVLFFLVQTLQIQTVTENGYFGSFTISMLKDGDFNIINQIMPEKCKWIVTSTGNYPHHARTLISVFLAPFFLYQMLLHHFLPEHFQADSAYTFLPAHILAIVFYVSFAFFLFIRLGKQQTWPHLKKALAFLALSTPFLYYFVFISTSNNIFALAFSIYIFCYYKIIEPHVLNIKESFLFGLFTGLALILRIQLYWTLFLPILYYFKHKNKLNGKQALSYLLGLGFVWSFLVINEFVRDGNFSNLLTSFPANSYALNFEFFFPTFYYSLVGPNGYLVVSPIYLVIFSGFLLVLFTKAKSIPSYAILVLPALILFLFYSASPIIMDGLVGRHQLDFFFIFTLLLSFVFSQAEKYSRSLYYFIITLCIYCALQSIIVQLYFYKIETTAPWLWQIQYLKDLSYISPLIKNFIDLFHLEHLSSNLIITFAFLPLILLLSFVLNTLTVHNTKKVLNFFFSGAIFIYGLFTILNVTNNDTNVKKLEAQGFYNNKVSASGREAAHYDDYVEVIRRTMYYYLLKDDCSKVKKLIELKDHFIDQVDQSLIKDNLGFHQLYKKGGTRKSYFEYDEVLFYLDLNLKTKCGIEQKQSESFFR